MVTYRKVFDPEETCRRLNLIVRLPETLAGLAEVPYRQEALFIDHILRQWILAQAKGKSVSQSIEDGSLREIIEQTLDRAKEDRLTAATPPTGPGKVTQRSRTAVVPSISSKTGNKPTSERQETVTVTVTPEIKPVTLPVTTPVMEPVTDQAKRQQASVTVAAETRAPTRKQADQEQIQTNSPNEEEAPAPPPDVANRLSNMFDDF